MQTLSRSDHLVLNGMAALTRTLFLLIALAVCSSQAGAASVFGRAAREDSVNPPGPCRATLQAEVDRRGAPDTNLEGMPDSKNIFSVPLNQSGYFHFVNVPPNTYMLTVECPTASGIRELEVKGKVETQVAPPVILEGRTLEVDITPKVDPKGQPWRLSVDATMPRLRRIASEAIVSVDGHWSRSGLVTGNYRVTVSGSDGTPWLQRFFNLSPDSGPLRLSLRFIQVSGEVRLSTRPLRARLVFHNNAGGEPATLTSDENGFFHGVVPVTPGVEETKWTVEARAANPLISRRLQGVSVRTLGETSAWLDLTLPVFAVHGTVVSEMGKAQSGAQVNFEGISSGARASTATDDDGGFEQQDLPPGKYIAFAESVEGVSERTAFQVAEGNESELKLVLNPSVLVPFYVTSSQGPVADAAVQVWIPPGVPHWFTHTDPAGRFEVKLPPGTTEIGLTVRAQGYALKLTRLQISQDREKTPNANTITLDTSGGTLVLDLQPQGRTSNSSVTSYLVHNGATEAVGTLVGWSTPKSDDGSSAPSMLETIEPGVYSLCLVVDPAELAALWFGASPSSNCRTVSVEQGETMTLSPP
jgi:hypothetical protein